MFNNLSLWSLGLNVLVIIITVSGFIKIMQNDLKHLSKSVTEISDNVKTLIDGQNKLDRRLLKQETKCAIVCQLGKNNKNK